MLGTEGAKFIGANFTSVDVKGDFRSANSEFQHDQFTRTAVDLEGMKVAGTTDLSDSKFDGYVGFGDIHFASLFLNNSKFLGNTNFTRARTESVFLDGADFLAAQPEQQELNNRGHGVSKHESGLVGEVEKLCGRG